MDGAFREFSSLRVGAQWVALGEIGNAVLALQATNVEPNEVKLVTIVNAMEYLEDDGGPR